MPAPRRSQPASVLGARVTIPEGILFKDLSGETVLLNLNTGVYFGLDHVGARAWQLLEDSRSIRQVHGTLLQEFDVSSETLECDLLKLLAALVEEGLLAHA